MQKTLSAIAAAAVLLSPLAACSQPAQGGGDFDARIRAYLLEHPEVVEEALLKLQEKRRVDAVAKAKAAVEQSAQAIVADPRDPWLGAEKPKVTVVEFFDYRCPYCKVVEPELMKRLAAQKDLRIVFKELPILSPQSEYAAYGALLAWREGKYRPVHSALMAEKNLDEAAIDRILTANGLSPAAARALGNDPEVKKHVADVQALAQTLEIDGTPAFVVNGEIVHGADMESLDRAIANARKG